MLSSSVTHAQNELRVDFHAVKIDSLIQQMSLKEKIGQLFFIDASANWSKNKQVQLMDHIKHYKPGGILLMQGDPNASKRLMKNMDSLSVVPLLYSIDGEWGLSMRIDSVEWFPKQMMLGAIRDNRILNEVGFAIGSQVKDFGIDINFAPVLDVNSNPENPVINVRSFGENPERVALKAYAFFGGMQKAGIMAVGKHYPGHGDTDTDSHVGLPIIDKSMEDLNNNELVPFRKAAQLGIKGLMTGHLVVPSLDELGVPMSLSSKGINYLRDSIGFTGMIFSDALNMRAVDKRYDKHYLSAFKAGNHVLLFPADMEQAFNEILTGVKDGIITEEEIDKRLVKLFQLKKEKIINQQKTMVLNTIDYKKISDRAIANAITLVKNDGNYLPLSTDLRERAMVVSIGTTALTFKEKLAKYRQFDYYHPDLYDQKQMRSLMLKAPDYKHIVVAVSGNVYARQSNYGLDGVAQEFISKLPSNASISLVLFTNPYALRNVPKHMLNRIKSIVVAYESNADIEAISGEIVMGGLPAMGILPVTAGPDFPSGLGLYTQKSRLSYIEPFVVKMNKDTLALIDSIAMDAIAGKATPGCQILVVQNGSVIYDKSFGTFTYSKKRDVKWNDIYDLASLTKIAATLPVVMHLNEEGKIDLEQKLKVFKGLCSTDFKQDITIGELLQHQSGLKPYIPFQYMLFDTDNLRDGLFSRHKSTDFSIQVGENVYANRKAHFRKGFASRRITADQQIEVAPGVYLFNEIGDSIKAWIDSSEVDSSRSYRYSDLNFYYLEKVVEQITKQPLDRLTDSLFAARLGMDHTLFRPLRKIKVENIVPTENDLFFRKGLVQGYVHDQASAMVGGVAGHAGLFSNSNDLAKFGQMLLNNGWYGSDSYFDPKTIEYYTQTGNNLNRRGLGFDKPEPDTSKVSPACDSASLLSFGHSGFTGTYLWIDPQYQMIYIFLSNRIHPNAYNRKLVEENVRTRIQQKIYNAIQGKRLMEEVLY